MKLLIDENISWRIKFLIESYFDNIIHATQIKGCRLTDNEIFEYAKANNFSILTFDSDFSELISLKGFPPKIIWLKCGNSTKDIIASKLITNIEIIQKLILEPDIGIIEIF